MKTATRPEVFSTLTSIKRVEEAEKKGASDEEIHLFNLSETKGWELLTDIKSRLVNELDQVNETAIQNGATYEEIGKNTLVISLAKGIVNRLWDKVSDSKEACERSGDTGGK